MERETIEELRTLLDSVLTDSGVFLVDLVQRGQNNNVVLEIYIDGDDAVGTDTCSRVSRSLSHEMDRRGMFPGTCTLTVSSPGLDRPLRFPRQYPKHIGRKISVTTGSGPGSSKIRGTLVAVTGEQIEIRPDGSGDSRSIPFGEITTARIETRW